MRKCEAEELGERERPCWFLVERTWSYWKNRTDLRASGWGERERKKDGVLHGLAKEKY